MRQFSFHRRRGFTLLEVMLSLGILVLVAGGVFGVVEAGIKAVESLQGEQTRQTNEGALIELLRKNFAQLPKQSILTLEQRREERTVVSEVWLENAPNAFAWGRDNWFYGSIVLGLEVDSAGLMTLGIRRVRREGSGRVAEAPAWLPLVRNLRVCRWRFFNVETQEWLDSWDKRDVLPTLIKLDLQQQGDLAAKEITFDLPWTSTRKASQR